MKLRTIVVIFAVGLIGLFVGRSVTLSSTPAAAEEPLIRAKSNVIVDEVRFDGTPLNKGIDALRDKTHANIVVRWERIVASSGSATPQQWPVTLRLENVPLSTVLHHLTANIPGGLAFSEGDDGVIVVSILDDLPQEVTLRFYDISDLVRRSLEDDARWRREQQSAWTRCPSISWRRTWVSELEAAACRGRRGRPPARRSC